MAEITAPYRFVPLSPLVTAPDWADKASHDVPFADGIRGELAIELTTHTPLCVGGEQIASDEDTPGKVCFFRTPDNALAIPGSSIKGMLRNIMEMATFARFKQVEDQKLGVRDISTSNNFYTRAAKPADVRAGWLRFEKDGWQISPCKSFSRLHRDDLVKHFNIKKEAWVDRKNSSARNRYGMLGKDHKKRQITFDITHEVIKDKQGNKVGNRQRAMPSQHVENTGIVVVTGQPGPSKKYEFVFHINNEAKTLSIDPEVMEGFRQIHEKTDEWKFWEDYRAEGVPVFFHQDQQGNVKSLGLAMMYKLPYKNSIHDAIGHTSENHLDKQGAADLAELVFGKLDEGEDKTTNNSLRGRVNIGLARLAQDADTVKTGWTQSTVLNSPKPTFYPAYIRQRGAKNGFNQLMQNDAELAGWKIYPRKPEHVQPPPEKSKPSVQVKLEYVPADTRFQFKLRFHNLRPAELGALLWCINFGGEDNARHALGSGKPYGLGQISLQVQTGQSRLRFNNPDQGDKPLADVLEACQNSFTDMMDQALQTNGAKPTRWKDSGPIDALLKNCKPEPDTRALEYLPKADMFSKLKKDYKPSDFADTFHGEPLKADSVQLALQTDQDSLNTQLAAVDERRAQEKQQKEREEQRANASQEDKLLIDLEGMLPPQSDGNPLSNSEKKKIPKQIRIARDSAHTFNEAQRQQFIALLNNAEALGAEAINKAIKQARKRLEAVKHTDPEKPDNQD